MKFTAKTDTVIHAMSKVVRGLPADVKSALKPIYLSVLIQARPGRVVFSAFDGSMWVRAQVQAEVEAEETICVPGRMFNDLVQYLSGDEVVFETGDNRLNFVSGESRCQVAIHDWQQYPEVPIAPDTGFIKIPTARGLSNALNACTFSVLVMKPEEITPQKLPLTGIHIQNTANGFMFLSSDGKSGTKIELPSEENLPSFNICIPGRVASEAKSLFSDAVDIEFAVSPPYLFLESDGLQVIAPSINNYPATQVASFFSKVKDTAVHMIIERTSLVAALKQAQIFSTEMDKGVHLTFDTQESEIRIQSPITQSGYSDNTIPCTVHANNLEINNPEEGVIWNRYFLKQMTEMLQAIKTVNVLIACSDMSSLPLYIYPVVEQDGVEIADTRIVYCSMPLAKRSIEELHNERLKTQEAQANQEAQGDKRVESTRTKAPGRKRKVA